VTAHHCCWHPSRVQHSVMNHRDETCCHCGKNRCLQFTSNIPSGHGPYCTERVWERLPDLAAPPQEVGSRDE
jgi:hypothetical protein